MAQIPQLMNGQQLAHDIKFSSSGPISGIVHGIQSISAAGNITLSLDESNTQLKSDVLSIDPGGADRNVLLPTGLKGGNSSTEYTLIDLAGRIIRIYNAADGRNEDLTIYESDGTTFIARVGGGASVEIMFPAQGSPICLNPVFESTATHTTGTGDQIIVDRAGADYCIIPISSLVASPDGAANPTTYLFKSGGVNYSQLPSTTLDQNKVMRVPGFVDNLSDTHASFQHVANSDITMTTASASGRTLVVKTYYRVVKKTLQPMS